nr:helix-turn-helix domain-containing protein [Georgenia yuyongxinii]
MRRALSDNDVARAAALYRGGWSQRQIAELVEAYRAGSSPEDLAEHYGLRRRTVVAYLRESGQPVDRRVLTDKQVAEVTALYATGMTTAQIGQRFGVSDSTAKNILRRAGVELRPGSRRPAITDAQVADVGTAYLAGQSSAELAGHYGVSVETIRRYLARAFSD